MRQQVDEADGPCRRDRGEGHRAAASGINAEVGQLGQHPVDRIVERDEALFGQLHEGHRSHRLGHAGDPQQRIFAHPRAVRAQHACLAKMHRLPLARDKDLHPG